MKMEEFTKAITYKMKNMALGFKVIPMETYTKEISIIIKSMIKEICTGLTLEKMILFSFILDNGLVDFLLVMGNIRDPTEIFMRDFLKTD